MREIVFDTETTGFSFPGGDRMVEIGCVELINRVETGRTFHAYYHPERRMPAEATRVHGHTDAFLSDKPLFSAGALALIEFLGDAPLIAHNADFDFSFLNGEFDRCGHPAICLTRKVDTLAMAKQRLPGAKHSLDALCSRFGIDRSHRVVHGALMDAQLLAQVYVELCGGRQIGLTLVSEASAHPPIMVHSGTAQNRPMRVFSPSMGELAAHRAFMAGIADPIWGETIGADASG